MKLTIKEMLSMTPEQKAEYRASRRPIIQEVLDLVNKTRKKDKYVMNDYNIIFLEMGVYAHPVSWEDFILDNWEALKGSKFENDAMVWILGNNKDE
jgi:hypothetical protein